MPSRSRAKPPPAPAAPDPAAEAPAAADCAACAEGEEPSFRKIWDKIEPGARVVRGVYSIYKTAEGGMHIAYRPEGAYEDQHLPVPPPMMAMMLAASEGKGPLGRFRALVGGLG